MTKQLCAGQGSILLIQHYVRPDYDGQCGHHGYIGQRRRS